MGLTYKAEDMYRTLEEFDEQYEFPVYTSISNKSGFFSSSSNQHFGFAAVSDKTLLIADHNILYMRSIYEIPLMAISKIQFSKVPLINTNILKIHFLSEGKKMRFDLTIPSAVVGGGFTDQKKNSEKLIDFLKMYA